MKITVERFDEFLVSVPQIFDRVKSVALWSAKKKEKKGTIKGYGVAARGSSGLVGNRYMIGSADFLSRFLTMF